MILQYNEIGEGERGNVSGGGGLNSRLFGPRGRGGHIISHFPLVYFVPLMYPAQ